MSSEHGREKLRLPAFEEEIASCWAALLVFVADELGAPIFAADLAEHGFGAAEMMAGRWEDGYFEPAGFAAELRDFAAACAA